MVQLFRHVHSVLELGGYGVDVACRERIYLFRTGDRY